MRYITVPLPEQEQWQIMTVLHKSRKALQLTEITEQVKAETQDDVVSLLKLMIKDGLIDKDDTTRNVKYFLSENATSNYFTFDDSKIGTDDDIPRVTKKVIQKYLEKGIFITMASQSVEKGKYRSDLIGYYYEDKKSISIEIESASELASHPEHARLNMKSGETWALTCVIAGLKVRDCRKFMILR